MDDVAAERGPGREVVLHNSKARHARVASLLEHRRARCAELAAKRDQARSPAHAAQFAAALAAMEEVTARTVALLIASEEAVIALEVGRGGGDGVAQRPPAVPPRHRSHLPDPADARGRDTAAPITPFPRRPDSVALARARAAYALAAERILAAEEVYARALVALWQAEGADGAARWLPPRLRHFLCGHDGMERTQEEGHQVLSLCPACRARQDADPATFTERRRLLVREPAPDDPA